MIDALPWIIISIVLVGIAGLGVVAALETRAIRRDLREIDADLQREEIEKQQGAPTLVDSAPAEPAPGSDAEHPPVGYRLAKERQAREPGYIWWDGEKWSKGLTGMIDEPVYLDRDVIANPIPANEGDGRASESVEDVIKRFEGIGARIANMQDERDRALARVAELEADLETTKRLLADSLVERDRLKEAHDARKVRIEGFYEGLRERLEDLR